MGRPLQLHSCFYIGEPITIANYFQMKSKQMCGTKGKKGLHCVVLVEKYVFFFQKNVFICSILSEASILFRLPMRQIVIYVERKIHVIFMLH